MRIESAGAPKAVSYVYGVNVGDQDGRCYEVSRLPDLVPVKGLDAGCLGYDRY